VSARRNYGGHLGFREKEKRNFSDELQPLPGTDIPISSFFDLGENPGLDQSTASDHYTVDATTLDIRPVILGGKGIAATENGDPWHCEVGICSLNDNTADMLWWEPTYGLHRLHVREQH
jgi:hypothetical protein